MVLNLSDGLLRIRVCEADILRVQYTRESSFSPKTSLSISNDWGTTEFCVNEEAGSVVVTTTRMKAKVDMNSGLIRFTDLEDSVVLSEDSKSVRPTVVEGVATNAIETVFDSPVNEALYGLGQYQDGIMNRKGTHRHLINVNTDTVIPVLVSNRGYGIFWDNYSTSDFYGGEASNTKYRYVSEAGQMVDYYYFYGPSFDQVIAGYRTATGAAPMFPKWAYGLFQSKDKYQSQSELINIKNGYRDNHIPLDCVVQDWAYWDPYTWGSHLMDESRYPDPAGLVAQMHAANVHTMISIWPLYQYTASPRRPDDQDNYKALDAIGALFPSGGSHHFYDTLDAEARRLVYQQIYDRLVGNYGWDSIWADNTEPQPYPDSINMRAVDTALGKGALFINAYPLGHSKALYEGWRSVGPNDKRVYVLTRSGFAGQQRYATTCWSGDIDCDFPTYARQIAGGLSFAAAGMPYWTTDIGGYWGHSVNWSTPENNELFTRWFQYGAFCPIFRIHGGGSRELYGSQWSAATKSNLLKIDNLRYRLMPYIYSLAWKVTNDGYTMMRPLVFDYPNDSNVFDIKDQFLFGPAFLVNPITVAGANQRSVYFPAGTWYNFWTGGKVGGGNRASVSAPLSEIPLFVKAGSIVPMGPNIEYATESIDPLEIRVYRGADGTFVLYEDAGDTYDYESGHYSLIPFAWNESAGQLTIGGRSGSYSGMPLQRTLNIVWVGPGRGNGVGVESAPHQQVSYDGSEVVVLAPTDSTGTTIVVRMRGVVGDESVSLQVGGDTVQTWTLTTVMSDYAATTNQEGEIRVAFTNDSGDRDVQIDYISVNGEIRQAEDQDDNTGAWGNDQCGGGTYTEWLHCNGSIGFGPVSAPTGTTIVVRMRGVVGDENVSLQVGGVTVQSWTISTAMSDYSVTTDRAGEIRVAFTNDSGDRDVQVDYISVNGEIRQAEDQSDNTGAWGDGQCGGGSYTEWLHCNGSIGFGMVDPLMSWPESGATWLGAP
jgi:alpha-D-xyloside xylohydrolase